MRDEELERALVALEPLRSDGGPSWSVPAGMVEVYLLFDPRSCVPRYVGQTTRPLRRWQEHCRLSNLARPTHKNHWLRELVGTGLRPVYVAIDQVPAETVGPSEVRWIATMRAFLSDCTGPALTNGTLGGEGVRGRTVTEEERRRSSFAGRQRRRATRSPQERREASRRLAYKTVKHTEGSRRAISRANAGEANHAAKLEARDVATIRARLANDEIAIDLAREFGISATQMSRIRLGHSWREQ